MNRQKLKVYDTIWALLSNLKSITTDKHALDVLTTLLAFIEAKEESLKGE
jgi:hypothetical protein